MNTPQEKPALELTQERELDSEFERLLGQQMSARDLMLNDATFDRIMRIAESMAEGKHTVPKHLQGCLADCIAVTTQAFEWGMNPFTVAQKTHVVNGTLGYEAQLVMAVVQRSGAIKGHFHFEFQKDGGATLCRAGAVLRGDTEITWTEWHSSALVKVKNSPLWQTNVPQQMGYVQGRNWSRLYAPGAILGVYTVDELEQAEGATSPTKVGPRRKSDAPAPASASGERIDGDGVITGGAPAEAAAETKATDPARTNPKPAADKPTPPAAGNASGGISGGQVAYLRNKLKAAGVTEATISDRFQVTSIELLSAEQFDEVKAELLAMA
jgi:hypothetical protein